MSRGKNMKNKIIYLGLLAIAITACSGSSKKEDSPLSLSVATPNGAPALAFYKHLKEGNLEINADPTNIITYMATGSKDVVVLPTNAGVKAIKAKGLNYQIAATITFGNFYLAGTGNDTDRALNEGDYVVLFQQNNVPDILFKYVYGDTFEQLDVHYVTAVSDAASCLVSKKNIADNNHAVDYVLMAEPALTTALGKNADAYQYSSVQEKYAEKTDNKMITQASIFINKNVAKKDADEFLGNVKDDINELLNNADTIDSYVEGIEDVTLASKIGGNATTIKNMINHNNRVGLGFKKAIDNKASIDSFLSLWPEIGETSEEIYYQ